MEAAKLNIPVELLPYITQFKELDKGFIL